MPRQMKVKNAKLIVENFLLQMKEDRSPEAKILYKIGAKIVRNYHSVSYVLFGQGNESESVLERYDFYTEHLIALAQLIKKYQRNPNQRPSKKELAFIEQYGKHPDGVNILDQTGASNRQKRRRAQLKLSSP